ncbi:hypothetical protein AALO_G00142980 [Alosa alosa]|uniref:Uncharacterized protein n=1 Tax=Alosa alosa TaxID=278164 RepID=A0AAV6GNU1_9TELE|nr:hypothetical protein AALO_G00142980 [Alosa alosa]
MRLYMSGWTRGMLMHLSQPWKEHGDVCPLQKGSGMLTGASSSRRPLKLSPHSGHSSGTKKQKISLLQWLNLTTLLSMENTHGHSNVQER